MVAKKSKSKRQTLHNKFKVIKRVKDHEKKLKKGKIKGKFQKKINETGIPSAWPYKEQLLQEIQAAKDKSEMVRQQQKERRAEEIRKRRELNTTIGSSVKMDDGSNNMDGVDQNDGSMDLITKDGGQNSRRAFLKELRKVVDNSDVVLHVLDARDPLGTRSLAIEEMVLSNPNKKLIYILNKADLVPRDVLVDWLGFLRKSHPALLFKCNTQNQKGNLSRISGKISKLEETAVHNTSHAIGTDELLNILKNYCRAGGSSKAMISVGIVGFPNVGKSSLINSMVRVRKVGVSPVPGFTRQYQEVILDKNIRLIDCPGIVFAEENDITHGTSAAAALRNCVNVDEIQDVFSPLAAILERCPSSYLMQLYSIPRFKEKDVMAFLALVARTTGKLKKGGIPNTDAAARTILNDWNHGKIKYYCRLPTDVNGNVIQSLSSLDSGTTVTQEETAMVEKESKILSGYSNSEFKLNGDEDTMDEEGGTTEDGLLDQLDTELCDYVGLTSEIDPLEHREVSSVSGKKGSRKNNSVHVVGDVPKSRESVAVDRKIKQIKMKGETTNFQGGAATTMSNSIADGNSNGMGGKSSTDLRGKQKEEMKKTRKQARRSGAGGGDESYDFDNDFQY